MHEFWFKPPIMGNVSRAEQIDQLLGFRRNTKFAGRVFAWLFGGAVAITALISNAEKAFRSMLAWLSGG